MGERVKDYSSWEKDPTSEIRREMVETGQPHDDLAESRVAQRREWTTAELCDEFEVIGFAAPFCIVKRRSDGVKGSMEFTHSPRVYFNFQPH